MEVGHVFDTLFYVIRFLRLSRLRPFFPQNRVNMLLAPNYRTLVGSESPKVNLASLGSVTEGKLGPQVPSEGGGGYFCTSPNH